jgi:multiple sugar transport system ATP-binding protein
VACVTLDNVSKCFRGPAGTVITALRDLSLTVADGEWLALLGPSGSGKTTVLRLIAGLEEVTRGTLTLDGQVVNALPPGQRDVAMVFQHHALYPHLTVFDNLALGLRLRGTARTDRERRVQETADTLGLRGYLQRRPAALSGGERQRVALGRALVRRPKVLLLDEPLSSLDAPSRAQLRRELAQLHARLGGTMIHVTHDQAEALALGQRIAVLQAGVLQQVADARTLYRQPANLFVAGFIGSPPMNLLRGVLEEAGGRMVFTLEPGGVSGSGLDLPGGPGRELARYVGNRLVLGIRPEHVRLKASVARVPGQLVARVQRTEWLGVETMAHLRLGAQQVVARLSGEQALASGAAVSVELDAGQAVFFDPNTEQAVAWGA